MIRLLLVLSSFLLTLNVNTFQKFEWEQYGLSFSVPADFKRVGNNKESFEAKNDNIHLAIEVFDYKGVSAENMGEILGGMANDAGMQNAEFGELVLTTLEGAYIEGTVGGINMIFVALMDTDSNVALLASITYINGFEQDATDICNSFAIKNS
ncbi:hypothetical protein [Parabacteroides sp. PF5-9]|uniref:hypothetical protein n=1 Tax=Parabacteroides sp. PF5-9 TaxID=1742404 RepID=UPI0024730B12|nr:hypothetical protein [Parabacteroides sp. PF5-9]MDH6358440.1 hypothetical protein [Parabacteroides sp. PF5-9]